MAARSVWLLIALLITLIFPVGAARAADLPPLEADDLVRVDFARSDTKLPVSILPEAAEQPQATLIRLLPAGFEAQWRAGMVQGREIGEVRLALPGEEGQVLFRLREAAGGLSPARRAQIGRHPDPG